MRKNRKKNNRDIRMMVLDDDSILATSFEGYFSRKGYDVTAKTDPFDALETLKARKYDILLLDYLMRPICGDDVIEKVREFDQDVFIVLVTGHRDMVPPIESIWDFDIQGYYEKNGKLDQLEILVESCVKEIRQRRIIMEYQKGMEKILNEAPQLYGDSNLDETAEKILSGAMGLLSGKSGMIWLRAEDNEVNVEWGVNVENEDAQRLESYFCDSLESVEGTICVSTEEGNRKTGKRLLDIYSRQAAFAAANNILHHKLMLSLDEKEKAHYETVRALISAVELKDRYTMGHSRRVSSMASFIASQMGLDDKAVEKTALAGMFHDIGKIGIPDRILQKEGALSDEEFDIIRKHPEKGAALLSGISRMGEILDLVKYHHERVDGTGYPEGLKGSDIPIEARIIAISDSFDAMISERTYGKNLDFEEALSEIVKGRGNQFDGAVSDVLIRTVEKYGKEEFLRKAGII